MVCWFPAGCLLKSSLTRIDFGDTSVNFLREFSFSSLLKGGETKFYDSGFTIVAPLWMRRKMKVEMTKVRLQLINCGSKPRLPIDQINDCQIQHKCPPTPSTGGGTSLYSTERCSPSDLMKSQWEGEGDIIDTHPTTVGPHHNRTPNNCFDTKLLWCI